jgi:ATP-dependent helicase/DNAse subunit B
MVRPMPITLLTGPANAGKARVVLDAVRRDVARGDEPLLIVPTREDVEHYRRELSAAGAAIGVTVGRFGDLLDEVVARAGAGGEVLGAFARERALEVIAARRSPGGASSGYARVLGSFIDELRERRISGSRLRAAVEKAMLGEHALRVAEEVVEYEALLSRIKRVDVLERANVALDALRRSPWLWRSTPVYLYGFDDLTRVQLDAIQTLGSAVDSEVTVSLTFEAGRAAFASRAASFYELAPLAREHRSLAGRAEHYAPGARAALGHLERALFETDALRARACEGVRLLHGVDEREELELVAGEIASLLDAGFAPEEIAVAMRSPEAVADLLEDVFLYARIPFVLARERRFADTACGSALIGLLRSVDGGELPDLLAWLRTPGLLTRPELADRLEARARRAGIRRASEAHELWEREHWRLDVLQRLEEARSDPPKLIALALSELERAFARSRMRAACVLDAEELDEARALRAGRAALEELRGLVRIAPGLAPSGPRELAETLDALRFSGGPHAPARAGGAAAAVTVSDPLALRARRVRALFLCRMQAASFPALEHRTPLLGEEQRRRLAQLAALRLSEPRDALADERYLFYAALSRPQEALVLSWHGGAEDGTPRIRSQFIEEVCELFEGAPATLEAPPAPHAPVHAARLAEGGTPRPIVSASDRFSVAPFARAARASISVAELVPDSGQQVWSASSLGTWMSCPVRWFVERVLSAEDLDPRAEPLARGLLAHAALKDTLEALERETGSARVTRANLDRAREQLAAALRAREAELPLSAERERLPALQRRLHADLERYLEHAAAVAEDADAAGAGEPPEPRYLELEFGLGDDGLPPLELGGGVKLRGRIDRVDVGRGGDAVVYDYKGRTATPAAKWLERSELQVALYMRAVEQLLGLRPAGGFYQPLSGELRARGVLDASSGVALPVVSSDRRDAADVRELLEQAAAAAREAAAQAARGELEARPLTCSPRGGCAYPEICRCTC